MSSIQKQLGLQCYVLFTKTVGFRVNDLFLPVLVVGRGVEGLLLYGQSVLILVLQ